MSSTLNESVINPINDFYAAFSDERHYLRQLQPLKESRFIAFARDRGVYLGGVIKGGPTEFFENGLLDVEKIAEDGSLYFHPFQFYSAFRLEKLKRESGNARKADWLSKDPSLQEAASALAVRNNKLVKMAMILEPAYWPYVTGHQSLPYWSANNDEAFYQRKSDYGSKVKNLVKNLDVFEWQEYHRQLRVDAAKLDNNGELYLLLRLSIWKKREKLTGYISGALWIRHIAEIIRRVFEDVHQCVWDEEDQAFGWWLEGGRKVAFGAARPLDLPGHSRTRIVTGFGLATGSCVRWYVEGETELAAVKRIIPKPELKNIELINLKGNFRTGKSNIAMKLVDFLTEDIIQRRLSIISFDQDVADNVKTIKGFIQRGEFIGLIFANAPDFEFQNFSLKELIDIAIIVDEDDGFDSRHFLESDWSGVDSGKTFENRYKDLSSRKESLKGEKWGAALGTYALDNQQREDNGEERSFIKSIREASRARLSNYDLFKECYTCDPDSFEIKALSEKY